MQLNNHNDITTSELIPSQKQTDLR